MNLKTNADGDIAIENRTLVLVRGQEEIEQHIAQRFRTFFGEWFLNKSIGVPYFEEIFRKQVDIGRVQSIFIQVINETPGVIRLLEFSLDLDAGTREMTLSFKAETLDGVIVFSEELTA